MESQLSMFEMLGMDETPEIPFEQQKEGVKGWVIEMEGWYTVENGFREDMIGVTTVRVILEKDSDIDKYGISQYAHVIEDGCKSDGWYGGYKKLYAKRPIWREVERYAEDHRKGRPGRIVFTMKDGKACHHICDFETKKPIDCFG